MRWKPGLHSPQSTSLTYCIRNGHDMRRSVAAHTLNVAKKVAAKMPLQAQHTSQQRRAREKTPSTSRARRPPCQQAIPPCTRRRRHAARKAAQTHRCEKKPAARAGC